mgnify:FL=1
MKEVRQYVLVGAFVIGAIFTPPDVISQFLLAIPLYLLYELGLLLAGMSIKKSFPESNELVTKRENKPNTSDNEKWPIAADDWPASSWYC